MDQKHLPPSPAAAGTRSAVEGARSAAMEWDGILHAVQGWASGGLSLTAQKLALLDWAIHFANAPFQRADLARTAVEQWLRLAASAHGETAIVPPPTDHRFLDAAWRRPPFHVISQAFLLAEEWWARAAAGPPGIDPRNRHIVSFATRQLVDVFSPTNLPWLNPEVIQTTMATGGGNFAAGAINLVADLQETVSGPVRDQHSLRLGRDLAATPGKVVFRNELIELIQYAPSTPEVAREPVLIVPAWIMKYYILDLSPGNSLIGHLVAQGHTVFAISWRNPGAEFKDIALDDYRSEGIMAALDAAIDICSGAKVHACGYCLGGTLLAVAAATMARDGDDRLASVTLFCGQTDFTEAGELQLFITEDQVAFLEDGMRARGYLDGRQMTGAFQMLRSNDLVWSRLIKNYLKGEREHPNDLLTWNADGTRMPARMHTEYLRRLFLENELAEGRFLVGGTPIAIRDIRAPLFVVGAETDHIAPWRSVYKIRLLSDADLTLVLTSGGHNAGVVSEPEHPNRHFRVGRRESGEPYIGPDEWFAQAQKRDGSWWPNWWTWLDAHSSDRQTPPPMGSKRYPALEDAPGRYVLEH